MLGLGALFRAAREPERAMRRGAPPSQKLVLPIPVIVGRDLALAALLKLKDDVDRPPLDARFDLETKKLLPEQPGFFLDVYGTLAGLESGAGGGPARVPRVAAH